MMKYLFPLFVICLASCQSSGQSDKVVTDTTASAVTDSVVASSPQAPSVSQDTALAVMKDTVKPITCTKHLLTTIEGFKVYKLDNANIILFKAKMAIDADGSPRAYCPAGGGIDDIRNAGKPGNWYGVVTDVHGNPVVQQTTDPHPGCYVSPTTMYNQQKKKEDPARYVNAEQIPFIALPKAVVNAGVKIGDLAYVYNTRNGKSSFAIFADGGPSSKLGEGSVFLADQLGVPSSPKNGGAAGGIVYVLFPGSGKGNGTLRTLSEIQEEGRKLLQQYGGEQVIHCIY